MQSGLKLASSECALKVQTLNGFFRINTHHHGGYWLISGAEQIFTGVLFVHTDTECEINYTDCRCDMRNGDVLLFKGTGIFSKIIQWRTGSSYSHAGILSWWNGRLMVLEAIGKGVRAVPLSRNVRKYKGGIDYFRTSYNIDDAARLKMVTFAQKQLGREYAQTLVLKYAVMNLFGIPFSQDDSVSDRPAGKYFCSQYVAETYSRHGYDLQMNLSDRHTSPQVIAESEKMEYVGTLKE